MFLLPESVDDYVGADNHPHRPIMIHRAPFGSMERFVGILIEHFAGAFPTWLAPEQVRVLTVSDRFREYAEKVEKSLKDRGFRVHGDYRPDKIGAKVQISHETLPNSTDKSMTVTGTPPPNGAHCPAAQQ